MTIKEAWEYAENHLLNERALSDLEKNGILALAIIRTYMEDASADDHEYCLGDFDL
jgi:hypothetical protein